MSDQTVTKGEALAAIERERAAWEDLLAQVGDDRMLEPGPEAGWTFKDLVAHLSAWDIHELARLEAAANGRPDPDPAWPAGLSTDEINAWIHEANRDRLLGDVLEESRETYARLAAVVQMLPEDALNEANRLPGAEEEPLGRAIVDGSFFEHLHAEHEPAIRAWLESPPRREDRRPRVEL